MDKRPVEPPSRFPSAVKSGRLGSDDRGGFPFPDQVWPASSGGLFSLPASRAGVKRGRCRVTDRTGQVALVTAILGGVSGGGSELLANPNAETLGGVIVYAALAAVIGAVVWYFSFRPKKKPGRTINGSTAHRHR